MPALQDGVYRIVQVEDAVSFCYLRQMSNATRKRIEQSRRYRIRLSLMRNQGLSKEAAKELANQYHFRKPR